MAKTFLRIFLVLVGFQCSLNLIAQQELVLPSNSGNKGKMNVYWGWNRAAYGSSDIRFTGEGYDFTVVNASAHDRQTPLGWDPYMHSDGITIPQTNMGIGYFISDKYELVLGVDHMKYIMDNGDMVNLDGYISGTGTNMDGVYHNDPVLLSYTFLAFEHTDGLNYINAALRRHDLLLEKKNGKGRGVELYSVVGFGAGALYPKTNARIMQRERNDEFHLAGYGFDVSTGLRVELLKHFFIQGNAKGGFINMPDILTSPDDRDRASQHFWFGQINVMLGFQFQLRPID